MPSCKLIACLLALLLLFPISASALVPAEELPHDLMGEDLQAWAKGSLPAMAGEGGEWYAIALIQGEFSVDLTEYAVALTAFFVAEGRQNSVERQRCALTLAAMGITQYAGQTAEETIGKQGVMSLIFGLHLLQNGGECDSYTPETVAEKLASLQHEDGGWSVSGQYGDVDVTAMALQALAAQKERYIDAIESGIAFLESKQQPGGGFKSYGVENSESASQVIIALTALGIDPRTDSRFAGIMEAWSGFRLPDGRFAHVQGGEANGHACSQALLAYVALWRFDRGLEGLYAFASHTEEPPEVSVPPQISLPAEPSYEAEKVSQSETFGEEGMSSLRRTVLWCAVAIALVCGAYIVFPRKFLYHRKK